MSKIYNLQQFQEIADVHFHYEMPEKVFNDINSVCEKMKIPLLTSRIFEKQLKTTVVSSQPTTIATTNIKKKKGNKHMEVSDEEWNQLWSYKTTKMEKKEGIEDEIDQIRSILNKMSEKTFFDSREKIIQKLELLATTYTSEELLRISINIYEFMSTTRLNTSMFAGLFAELVYRFPWLNNFFMEKFTNIMEMYTSIQYVDADKDYDAFCEMNKINDKRKAVTKFYHQLAVCGLFKQEETNTMLVHLLEMVKNMIDQPNKKNEVDELTENIALLFDKNLLKKKHPAIRIVEELANMKAKDHPSLSNKAIFKYLDLIEM
jgi:hypothetical protein